MLYFICIIAIIAAILLVFVVLMQAPKGGGLSGAFGSTATQMFGARQSADFLEKATWYLGGGILIIVSLSYFVSSGGSATTTEGGKAKISNALDAPVSGQQKPGTGLTPQSAPAAAPTLPPTTTEPKSTEKK